MLSTKLTTLNFPRGCRGTSMPGQLLWRCKEPYFCCLLPTASPSGNCGHSALGRAAASDSGNCKAEQRQASCACLGTAPHPAAGPVRGGRDASLASPGRHRLTGTRRRAQGRQPPGTPGPPHTRNPTAPAACP